jgi:hypothetical protein
VSNVAFGEGANVERASRITLALTLLVIVAPWMLLTGVVSALVALVALVGTFFAATRATTRDGRITACMFGVLALITMPVFAEVGLEHWGRRFLGDYETETSLTIVLTIILAFVMSVMLGVPLSRIGVWAIDAAQQPSLDRLWRFGRKAGVLVACIIGIQTAVEHSLFGHDERALALIAFHSIAALVAACTAVAFDARGRHLQRWLAAVRSGTIPGWRVRALGAGDVLEMARNDRSSTPYRTGAQGDSVAQISLSSS